jgi:glutamyl-tRNA synthetase
MVNYLSLLGWNDGSEKEIYTPEELAEAFSIEWMTASHGHSPRETPESTMRAVLCHA